MLIKNNSNLYIKLSIFRNMTKRLMNYNLEFIFSNLIKNRLAIKGVENFNQAFIAKS